MKLGLAGGPLIMALILGRIGSIGKLYWFIPPSANLALRELGIVLFLSVVGLKSGGDFVNTLVNGEGLSWIGYGALITAVPLIIVGILARMLAKMNYLTMCSTGRFHDQILRRWRLLIIFIQPAVRRRSLTPLSIVGNVPAHYHPPITGGALLEYRLTLSGWSRRKWYSTWYSLAFLNITE